MARTYALFAVDSDPSLPQAMDSACRLSRLSLLAVKGLLADAEHNLIEPEDVELIHECVDTTELLIGDVQRCLEKSAAAVPAVHPPLNEPLIYGERIGDCPVCGAAILKNGENFSCDRCDVKMHPECFLGRVATLAEWQEYIRQVHAGPENYSPDVVCAQCRAKGEPA